LAFGPNGDLFLTCDQSPVFKYNANGVQSTFGMVTGKSAGITFDDVGNLFVGSRGSTGIGDGQIYRFSPTGARTLYASGLNDPQGLAFETAPVPATWIAAILGSFCLYGSLRTSDTLSRQRRT
jgi:hypothetical protein